MRSLQIPSIRSERLVAIGRLALAAFSLIAIWLDPLEPARHPPETYVLLVVYLCYAAVLAGLTSMIDWLRHYIGLGTHVLDLVIFSILLYLTDGSTSPFFAYFVFSLMAAALRWGWHGVLWTALVTLTIYTGLGLYADRVLNDPDFELNRFIIRSGYLAVVALLLGYLSAYEERLRGELAKLAAWPREAAHRCPVEQALQQTARVFGADRALMVWDESEEPYRHQAIVVRGTFEHTREPGTTAEALVAEPLALRDFLCLNAAARNPAVLCASPGGAERWWGAPLAPGLQSRLGCRSVLSLRLDGDGFQGRLFILDKPGMSADDLVLGEVVARQIVADLDQLYVQQRLHQAAISEERVRFARELHDGVLQSLTGLALQLKAVQHLMLTDQETARARIAQIENLVAAEQRDLRFFVQQLKPLPLSRTEVNAGLVSHLGELAARIERQWDLHVQLRVDLPTRQLSELLAHAVYRIVQEALANAARHGRARTARLDVAMRDDELHIAVADDGRGFPHSGRYDLATLNRMQIGPASIRERVAALGGGLLLESGAAGARLEITLPLRPPLRVMAPGPPAVPVASGEATRGTG